MSFVGSAASARRWLMLLPIAVVGVVAVAVAAERDWPSVGGLRLDTAPHDASQSMTTSAFSGGSADAFASPCASADEFAMLDPSAAASATQGGMESCITEQVASGAQGAGVLTQITTWRREGNSVVLIRSPGLHHRLGTN